MAENKSEKYFYAKGRRKTSVATIRLYEGKGESLINDKKITEVYPNPVDVKSLYKPLYVVNKREDFYFTAKSMGGGKKGQLGAIRHALSRALDKADPSFHDFLKKEDLLTRDPRMVERKKTGLRKARKTEQYSKR